MLKIGAAFLPLVFVAGALAAACGLSGFSGLYLAAALTGAPYLVVILAEKWVRSLGLDLHPLVVLGARRQPTLLWSMASPLSRCRRKENLWAQEIPPGRCGHRNRMARNSPDPGGWGIPVLVLSPFSGEHDGVSLREKPRQMVNSSRSFSSGVVDREFDRGQGQKARLSSRSRSPGSTSEHLELHVRCIVFSAL